MAWISLVCLLALSSVALGRATYGSFSSRSLHKAKLPVQQSPLMTNSYAEQTYQAPAVQQQQQPALSYGSSYGAAPAFPQFDRPIAPTHPLTEADILCKGQRPETIIPIGQGQKFIVCLDESKGVEQFCPKDLLYNAQTRRCERQTPLENACAAQPCLNGGQCIRTEHSFQCQCTSGFEGKVCELDARVCQTQQPCGQSYDNLCQSFHVGAALQHVCIVQDGLAYGLTSQQTHANPCQNAEGPHALAFSNKGFIVCNGEHMFVQSCPGGTIWDNLNKACVWPEMEGMTAVKSYSQSNYGAEVQAPRLLDAPVQQQSYSYSAPMQQMSPVFVQKQQDFIPMQKSSGY